MEKFILSLLIGLLLMTFNLALVVPRPLAAEKLKVGTSQKVYAGYYLPMAVAEEKGYWRENGLEAEWVPFAAGADFFRALASGAVFFGISTAVGGVQTTGRGVPMVITSEFVTKDPFLVWVLADSRFKELRDLKGAKVGVPRFGASSHAFGQAMAKALGIEVRWVSIGGMTELLGGFKVGRVDVILQPLSIVVRMKAGGEVRDIGSVADFLPREWMEHATFAHKDFAKKNPDTVRKAIKALLQGVDFLKNNPRWAIEKMRSEEGLSESAARLVFQGIQFTKDGRVDKKAVENIKNFLAEYGIIPKDKVPATEEFFVPGLAG